MPVDLARSLVLGAALAASGTVFAGSVPLPETPGRGIVPEAFPAAPPYQAPPIAAVWSHSATVQSKVLETTQAYVAYVDAKAQLAAARTTEAETAKNLDAAQQRREAGLATIADVLQARTQHSQATLAMQTIEGS